MARDKSVSREDFLAAVRKRLPEGYDVARGIPSFNPLERDLFRADNAVDAARIMATRHMLGTNFENLPYALSKYFIQSPNREALFNSPNISFTPVK